MAEFKSDAARWHKRYDIAAAHQEPMFKKFAAWYDIAATTYPKDRKPAIWRSKVLFPTLGNKAYQLAAKFIGLKPGWSVKAQLPDLGGMPDEKAKKLLEQMKEQEEKAQRKLDWDYNCPEMDDSMRYKLLAVMMDAIIPGTGLGKAPWTVKEKEHYERVIGGDGVPDMSKEKVTTKTSGFNDFIPCDIFNVFKSPTGSGLYNSPWIIIKEYKTLSQLQDTNKANGGKFYHGLDQLTGAKAQADQFSQYKAARNRLVKTEDTVQLDGTIDQFPVYECYDLDKKTISWYVDSAGESNAAVEETWVEIRSTNNFYWHGKYPLVAFYVKRKPHEFWGQGIFEINERIDAGRNDIFNHYMDEWNVSASGGVIAEEGSIINDYVIEPGFEITYKGTEPKQWKFPEPNPAQLTTLSTMLDRAIEDGTISAYSAGTPNSATDTTAGTKGGILALQQGSDDILSFGRENFRDSLTQLGKFFLSNNQQFMSQPMTIRDAKGRPMTITPADMQGELELTVTEDSMQPKTKAEELQEFQAWVQAELALVQASNVQAQGTRWAVPPLYIDFSVLHEDLSHKFGLANSEKILLAGQEVQQAMQNSQTPMVMPNERINITPADLLPSELAQLLQRNGITPDPSRAQGAEGDAEQLNVADAQATAAGAASKDAMIITPDHMLRADAQAHAQAIAEHKMAFEAAQAARPVPPTVKPPTAGVR